MPKILLVEDNEMNRDMLSRRLQRDRQVKPGRRHVQPAGAVEGAAQLVEPAAVDGESHRRCVDRRRAAEDRNAR